ncbi:hypothetical protein DL96DRAFT_1026113 [Flagelloscypha sp. PMI_526]|nr:hypothetical protein DL96DRAFT_1026113 [Flagelloscypha sp. PMI_526]
MPVLPPTPPMTPYSTNSSISSDESGEGGYKSSKLFKLKRPIQARPPRTRTGSAGPMVPPKLPSNGFAFPILEEPSQKPLPRIQKQTVWTQSQILHTCFSPGFPKRPRLNFEGRKHPSIEEVASLPDGLFRNKIPLDKNILGSIDWPGVSVKVHFFLVAVKP